MKTAESAKLLVLTSTFPRWQDDTEPRFVEYLSYELAKDFDVVVLAPHYPGALQQETISNGKQSLAIHRYRYFMPSLQSLTGAGGILVRLRQNPLRMLLVPFLLVAQLIAIARLHRQHRFDAIHAHWIIPQGLVAATFHLLTRQAPPLLVTMHGSDLLALRGPVMSRLKRWAVTRAKRVTVVSEAMRAQCVAAGYDDANISVRSMGVDLRSTFTPGEARGPRRGLIFVGRLIEIKGLAHLIEAMASLVRNHPDLRLTVVGDGPERQSMVDLTAQYQLQEHVRFVGGVPNTQLPDLLRAAQVAVMPSLREGLGLVAIEAMGCGCAVVASDLPAIRDVVLPGQTGLVARAADAVDLADKIGQLLADENMRSELAANARRYAIEHFDWQTVGEDYAEQVSTMIGLSAR